MGTQRAVTGDDCLMETTEGRVEGCRSHVPMVAPLGATFFFSHKDWLAVRITFAPAESRTEQVCHPVMVTDVEIVRGGGAKQRKPLPPPSLN